MTVRPDPNLIAGIEGFEDAGVYKISDDLALILTLDFFTPIVDDPYLFGQIAAVNALSDVYAMGGKPLTAMNIICFPPKKLPMEILNGILQGGLDKIHEADVTLVGGHSVEDDEPKYGLSVTGVIDPKKVLRNNTARPGDRLILTKAIGTGIVSTALKGGEAPASLLALSIGAMTTLNRRASELMVKTPGVHACTDITGFGFLGHACEMIEGTETGLRIFSTAVPVFDGLKAVIDEGYLPGGLYRNKNFRMSMIEVRKGVPEWRLDLLFDPQTSGGLLISLEAKEAEGLVKRMRDAGVTDAAVVGEVTKAPEAKIIVE